MRESHPVAIFILLARSALHLGHGGATNLHKMQKTLQTGVKISLERIVAAGSQRRRLEGRVSDAPWRSRRAGGTVWDAAALHSAPPIVSLRLVIAIHCRDSSFDFKRKGKKKKSSGRPRSAPLSLGRDAETLPFLFLSAQFERSSVKQKGEQLRVEIDCFAAESYRKPDFQDAFKYLRSLSIFITLCSPWRTALSTLL